MRLSQPLIEQRSGLGLDLQMKQGRGDTTALQRLISIEPLRNSWKSSFVNILETIIYVRSFDHCAKNIEIVLMSKTGTAKVHSCCQG